MMSADDFCATVINNSHCHKTTVGTCSVSCFMSLYTHLYYSKDYEASSFSFNWSAAMDDGTGFAVLLGH